MVNDPNAICRYTHACAYRSEDMRCCCGKLLAKLTKDGVIIRCARCKREMVVDLAAVGVDENTGWAEVTFKEKTA